MRRNGRLDVLTRFLASLATAAMLTAGLASLSGCSDDGPGGPGGAGGEGGEGGQGGAGGGNNECAAPADCPGTDTDCATRTCDQGACGVVYAPQGTATTDQSSGDCKQSVCDGKGQITSAEDTADVLDDANPCTEDTCDGGAPVNTNVPAGAQCDVDGGKKCNGEGACVECLDAIDCESGVCTSNACVAASCMDGVKNGVESDVDCGGTDCAPCDDALACVVASDCKSSVCTDGICVAPACDDLVENGEETDLDCGGPTCGPCGPDKGCVVDGDCVGGTCSGSVCVPTCSDAVKNANETDVDCGGPLCAKCEPTLMCSVDSDCASGVCTGNVCQAPVCGDGVLNGAEACDDGNQDDTDACVAGCKAAACGDGFQRAGVEGCDDGNLVNTDTCTSACQPAACGDGYQQAGVEQCDDGNQVAGDCCATSCTVEAGCEIEPNNTCAAASPPVAAPTTIKASITPVGDQDFLAFTVPATADLKIETFQGATGTCPSPADTVIQFRGADCTTVIDSDDEGGINSCSLLDSTLDTALRRVAPGTYYVRVEDYQNNGTIPNYLVQISFNALCGDGLKQGTEQCDDGNLANGDGCASNCLIEATPEVEPNNTCAEAIGPFPVPTGPDGLLLTGAITPVGDDDWYAFTLTSVADVHIETFDLNGPGTCASVDTVIQLYSECGTALGPEEDQGAISNCSRIDPTLKAYARRLPPGTYRVKVIDYQDNTIITGYKLQVKITALCGNGVVEGSEECDGSASCTPTCESLLERVCNDGVDEDGDGNIDCADTDCAFGCSLATPCAAGEQLVVYRSKDTPVSIPDLNSTTSTINASVSGTIQRAAVRFNISHAWIEDVDVTLASPTGMPIDLASDNGADGDNYVNTTLDDTCTTSITAAAPPFTGCFSPEAPLATFNGQAAAGAWKLAASDDESIITGTLNNWSLALCVTP